MPKPVRKKRNSWKEGEKILSNEFKKGYYCPECLEWIEQPVRASAPKRWHDECRPPRNDPRLTKRICPGCGVCRYRGPGNSTAFCSEICRVRYIAHFSRSSQGHREKVCIVCEEPVKKKSRTAKRFSLCHSHLADFLSITTIRKKDQITQRFPDDQAVEMLLDPSLQPEDLKAALRALESARKGNEISEELQ